MSSVSGHTCKIGEDCPVFIIAEIGVNHNGDKKLAEKLITAAASAGADAVKFQTYSTDELAIRSAPKADYQSKTSIDETQYDMLKKYELCPEDFISLSCYSQKSNLIFLSTPFDKGGVDLLDRLNVPMFKIGSGEITNFPLLQYIATKKRPIILSTGMSTISEIAAAVNCIKKAGNEQIMLLHCVSDYPAKERDLNLRVITTLRNTFKLPVGFSDHSLGKSIAPLAVALGACIIEKHITLDHSMPGPDHSASLTPRQFKEFVYGIRHAELAMGDGIKTISESELKTRTVVRRSIVARVAIPANTIIREDMLACKRPATGISPEHMLEIVGKRTKRAISPDEIIDWGAII